MGFKYWKVIKDYIEKLKKHVVWHLGSWDKFHRNSKSLKPTKGPNYKPNNGWAKTKVSPPGTTTRHSIE